MDKFLKNTINDLRQGENLDIYITVIIGIILAILGLLDVIEFNLLAAGILMTISSIAGSLLSVRRSGKETQDRIQIDVQKQTARIEGKIEMVDSLKEIRVRPFKDFATCLQYANDKIRKAKLNVFSVYWDADLNFEQIIGKNVIHREILLIDESNQPQYQAHLHNRLHQNRESGYSCAYVKTVKEMTSQFIIVDANELIFLSRLTSHNLSVRHPLIIQMFQQQYDNMWQKATRLKLNEKIYIDKLSEALAKPLEVSPADLEKCVRNCLQQQELLRNLKGANPN